MTLPATLAQRLRLPLIAAPMLRVSGVDLVSAACCAGVIAAFPTVNARWTRGWHTSLPTATAWSGRLPRSAPTSSCGATPTPLPRTGASWCTTGWRWVIVSVGSPAAVVGPLHDAGCLVFADAASLRHAEKALAAGLVPHDGAAPWAARVLGCDLGGDGHPLHRHAGEPCEQRLPPHAGGPPAR